MLLYFAFSAQWLAAPRDAGVTFIDYRFLPPLSEPVPPPAVFSVVRSLPAAPALPRYTITSEPPTPEAGAFNGTVMPPDAGASTLAGIGRAMRCNYAEFDALADKAECAAHLAAHPPPAPFALTAEELRLERHFATAMAARHSPPLMPCGSTGGPPLSIGTLICLANGMAKGFSFGAAGIPTYVDHESDEYADKGGPLRF